jgi:hypothetical protein
MATRLLRLRIEMAGIEDFDLDGRASRRDSPGAGECANCALENCIDVNACTGLY